MNNKTILLVISGGIAAYKALELIRLLKKSGASVRCILTKGGAEFVTPLSVSALSEHPVYTDLWSLKDESEMGHIRLTREADLICIAPASANLMAKIAQGRADDLASTTLLATDAQTPILICPAMNPEMWQNPATQRNIAQLEADGHIILPPENGLMACGEEGPGRLPVPETIFTAIEENLAPNQDLKGKHALVTAGPTFEPIDPVRFIGNRSSGKQGYAIAQALQKRGATVTLISGPVALPAPANIKTIQIETAQEMLHSAQKSLPADIAICAAAVGDWSPVTQADQKIKKQKGSAPPALQLQENPDILHALSTHKSRPKLVIGFAAETQDTLKNAQEKLARKNCDYILANSVAQGKIFGQNATHLHLISPSQAPEDWGDLSKTQAAKKLVDFIANHTALK